MKSSEIKIHSFTGQVASNALHGSGSEEKKEIREKREEKRDKVTKRQREEIMKTHKDLEARPVKLFFYFYEIIINYFTG